MFSGMWKKFSKYPNSNNEKGGAYDYSSIMHGGQYVYGVDRKSPTLTTKDPR